MKKIYQKNKYILYEIFTSDEELFSYYLGKINYGNLYYLYGSPTRSREYAITNIDKWLSITPKNFWDI